MNFSLLSTDDLPEPFTPLDRLLRLKLEEAAGKHFYLACDRATQDLLLQCEWRIVTNADTFTLAIACPNIEIYWHIASVLPQLGHPFAELAGCNAKIRISPPLGQGEAFDIWVKDIPS